MNTLPLSIGIETLGGIFSRIAKQNVLLPFKIVRTLETVYDNQPRINLNIYMGEREIAAENKLLGTLTLNTPIDKRGKCKINLTMNVSKTGDVTISAKEEITKKSFSMYKIIFRLFNKDSRSYKRYDN